MQNRYRLQALGLLVLSGGAAAVAPHAMAAPKAAAAVRVSVPVKVAAIPEARIPAKREKRISLDFVGADINDVIKALALQANVNIVTAADVKGLVTVSLNRVSITDALDMVARLSGYQYAKHGPAYVVGTDKSVAALTSGSAPAQAAVEPVTELVPYRFVRTADLGRALQTRFPDLKVSLGDDKTEDKSAPSQPRMLVVTGSPERVPQAKEFVALLDQAATFPAAGTVTEVYRIKYASPTDLANILSRLVPTVQVQLGPTQGFQSGSTGASASYSNGNQAQAASSGAGTANPSGAVASGGAPIALLLTGPSADIDRALQVLTEVDVRAPQMTFEARVMDVGTADLSRIGLTYDFGRPVRIGEAGAGTEDADSFVARPLKFGAILRSPYDIGVQLDLLAQNNQARLLANPNLSALDGQPAVVFIGDQIKYVIRQEVTPTGVNIQTETATVGITLKVTGKASPDGTVTLYVHPEVSVISGYLAPGNGLSLPQIATRFVDTTIRVKNGETIAIGGLIRESDITNIQKVPFLGDLPFFGQLFRRTEKNRSRSEIVIFITSRILND